jgi:hypothetical protein
VWRAKNPGKDNEAAKRRRVADPTKDRSRSRRHYNRNKEGKRARAKKWIEDNRETYLRVARESAKRQRSTIKGRLEDNVSRAIRRGIETGGKQGATTFEALGYSCDELMFHLEKKFTPGMSWENYGIDGWEIDHKIPRSLFNYSHVSHIDFKRCWSLENLQPMWASDNRSKQDKYDGGFQPSLAV